MRFAVAVLCWLVTTIALAVAIPAAWIQLNIVDEDGYAALAQRAAADPQLQSAMAGELTTRAMALIIEHGGGRYPIDSSVVHDAAASFTAGPAFPQLFAQLNRAVHAYVFSDPASTQDGDQWLIDLAPMLKDPAIQQMLNDYHVTVPATLRVPVTATVSQPIRQGQLRRLAVWGPGVTIGAVAISAVGGLLTLLVSRGRGRAMSSLGVSVLLVGALGWAGLETGTRWIDTALNQTTGDIRRVAEVMVGYAERGVHLWLNLALIAGAGLVVLGVLAAVGGSVVRPPPRP
ncbi:hypothetical protein [Mycobacterium sp. 1423905.2]|uniref:hypothetical protein n=1 Tax=Mycobacterium sp. 1423905.2 TaxID=1856859 RepID=UPI0007FE48ED|nr:hypothetical protein [Mycobacterium sp. 1423905.2]OBJ48876.1 hypothetical protein A9W95_03480 [Mycobacterium sp. 1423905.2]